MEEKVVLSDTRYEEIRALVTRAAGDRIDEFDAVYTGRSSLRREIQAKIVADHSVSYGEFRGYFEKFGKRCMELVSDADFEKTEKLINSVTPSRSMHRVETFHLRGAEKLANAGYSVQQIVGAYGRHWTLMTKLQRELMDKEGIPHG